MDKSDNESSEIKSVGRQSKNRTNTKMSHYNSNLNEPIEEVEDEKEENLIDQKIISKTIQKRRKATQHIDRYYELKPTNKRSILMDSDPILEENENEVEDDVLSENNFYLTWENHKRYLLTQDEQLKLLNDDARSSTGFFE